MFVGLLCVRYVCVWCICGEYVCVCCVRVVCVFRFLWFVCMCCVLCLVNEFVLCVEWLWYLWFLCFLCVCLYFVFFVGFKFLCHFYFGVFVVFVGDSF